MFPSESAFDGFRALNKTAQRHALSPSGWTGDIPSLIIAHFLRVEDVILSIVAKNCQEKKIQL
jgi:hypothetical protein